MVAAIMLSSVSRMRRPRNCSSSSITCSSLIDFTSPLMSSFMTWTSLERNSGFEMKASTPTSRASCSMIDQSYPDRMMIGIWSTATSRMRFAVSRPLISGMRQSRMTAL